MAVTVGSACDNHGTSGSAIPPATGDLDSSHLTAGSQPESVPATERLYNDIIVRLQESP